MLMNIMIMGMIVMMIFGLKRVIVVLIGTGLYLGFYSFLDRLTKLTNLTPPLYLPNLLIYFDKIILYFYLFFLSVVSL